VTWLCYQQRKMIGRKTGEGLDVPYVPAPLCRTKMLHKTKDERQTWTETDLSFCLVKPHLRSEVKKGWDALRRVTRRNMPGP